MMLMTERGEDILADLHLTLLSIGRPDYRFSAVLDADNRRHWLAMDRADSKTIVVGCLDEMLAKLGKPGPATPGALPAAVQAEGGSRFPGDVLACQTQGHTPS